MGLTWPLIAEGILHGLHMTSNPICPLKYALNFENRFIYIWAHIFYKSTIFFKIVFNFHKFRGNILLVGHSLCIICIYFCYVILMQLTCFFNDNHLLLQWELTPLTQDHGWVSYMQVRLIKKVWFSLLQNDLKKQCVV